MKTRNLLILLSLFLTTKLVAQSTITGFVIYTVDLSIEFRESYQKVVKKKKTTTPIDRMILESPTIKAVLTFNNKTSMFQVNEMKNDTYKGQNFIKLMAGSKNKFYSNSTTKETLEQDCEILGECFLIKQPLLVWKITQESKQIGKFTCYKALIEKNYKGRKSYIVAWFTPEIPVNFGPKEYNGLPGLVLELVHKGIIFKATRIELNNMISIKMSRKIKKPRKGKVVTKKEFRVLFSKATNHVFEK